MVTERLVALYVSLLPFLSQYDNIIDMRKETEKQTNLI
jgi:hypothetical protein